MNVDAPFGFDDRGRTTEATDEDHVRDMIEAVLLTGPGERVMRPDFGAGLLAVPFAPNGAETGPALELIMQASLQRWLGDVVEVRRVTATSEDSTLAVVVEYAIRRTGQAGTTTVRGVTP